MLVRAVIYIGVRGAAWREHTLEAVGETGKTVGSFSGGSSVGREAGVEGAVAEREEINAQSGNVAKA